MNKRFSCLIVLVSLAGAAGYGIEAESVTLESVRTLVARNEALLNPIKVSYTVKKSRTGDRPQPTSGPRPGRSYSHFNCVWAQSGEKHYARADYFYGPGEPASSTVKVIDPDRVTEGKLPDLMKGTIYSRDKFDWYSVLVAELGLRLFEGYYTLSQVLVSEHVSLHRKTEIIEDRETYVVDVKRPTIPAYFARIWIDRQCGMPLRIWYFGRHPNRGDEKSTSQINDIKLYQLPNGGWIPIEGVRSIHFSEWISYEHITVDVNSITIRREDIPDSLFRIDFPAGAGIYNVISGLRIVKGQPLKTYEQIVNAGGTYIAGMVVDEIGSPISGVVVGPHAVRTKQNTYKLIQGYERPCAITDTKGRFAIELDEEGSYDLLVFPEDFVDMRVRNVPPDKHDLKVILSKGGTVTGRVVRLVKDVKVPVSNVEVEAKEGSTIPLAFIRRHRLSTTTDAEGGFQIKYLETLTPKRRTSASEPVQYIPLAWQISCGLVSETVQFENGRNIQEVELVLKPVLEEAEPLIGRALPDFGSIKIDLAAGQTKDKMILICFFDMNQRPSRNYILRLAEQAERLGQKGISPAAVQVVKVDEDKLKNWVIENNVPFSVGMIEEKEECVRFDWAVCSLPWLILTDRSHVVRAEGFGFDNLDNMIKEKNNVAQ